MSLHERLAEVLVNMEQNNLTITTTNTDFIIGNNLETLDTLSAYWLGENKHLILNLEWAEVSWPGSSEQEFFIWFWECEACVVSYHCSSLDSLIFTGTKWWIKRPQSQFFRTCNSKLIAWSISKLNIFDISTPANSGNTIWEDSRRYLKRWNDITIWCVPDKELTIKLVTSWDEQIIIMREW